MKNGIVRIERKGIMWQKAANLGGEEIKKHVREDEVKKWSNRSFEIDSTSVRCCKRILLLANNKSSFEMMVVYFTFCS